jgi:hypothetical protein
MLLAGNEPSWQQLAFGLFSLTQYALLSQQEDDDQNSFTKLPAFKEEIKVLMIHCRYLNTENLVNKLTPENICMDCTILHNEGTLHPTYTKQLFKIGCIQSYIGQNNSNRILSQMEDSTVAKELVNPQQVNLSFSQQVNLSFSQQAYMQPFMPEQNPFAMMGYGL